MRHDRSLDEAARTIAGTPGTAGTGRGWLAGLAALWLVACGWLLASHMRAIATLSLPDSDDDLRLLQVRDWIGGQGWFDLRQYRLDPPVGADIHWSRLVDLPLAAIIRPLTPLLGSATAESVAVAAVPLVTLFAAMALLGGIARRTIAPGAWWWPPLLLLAAGPVVDMMTPLRIDHHGWQIVALLALLFGLVERKRRRGGLVAGFAITASLAIGVEMLPYLALGAGLAALGWIVDPREKERLRALCLATATGTIVALLLFVPPAQRLAIACDALSAAYALPLLAACAVLGIAAGREMDRAERLCWLAGAALAAAVPLLLAGGTICLTDPYHAVDPAARRLWLDRVSEAQPLWRQTAEVAWASLVLPLIGLAGAVAMLVRSMPAARRGWAVIAAMAALAILLALLSTRSAVAAQALALPGAAALGAHGRARLAAHRAMLVRVLGSVLLLLSVSALLPRLLIAALAATPETKAEAAASAATEACLAPRAIAALDRLPPATLLGFVDATPALLLHGHHRGLAGPYHRNGRAIAETMRAWAGTSAEAEAIVRRHRIGFVVACGEPAEGLLYDRRAPRGFHARLMRGEAPAWLAPRPLAGTPWRVWAVRPLRGSGPSA